MPLFKEYHKTLPPLFVPCDERILPCTPKLKDPNYRRWKLVLESKQEYPLYVLGYPRWDKKLREDPDEYFKKKLPRQLVRQINIMPVEWKYRAHGAIKIVKNEHTANCVYGYLIALADEYERQQQCKSRYNSLKAMQKEIESKIGINEFINNYFPKLELPALPPFLIAKIE